MKIRILLVKDESLYLLLKSWIQLTRIHRNDPNILGESGNMSKIMKVVYQQEFSESTQGDYSRTYMGEESWSVGEKFNGEFIRGKVSHFTDNGETISMVVEEEHTKNLLIAIGFPYHAVNRIYYGE